MNLNEMFNFESREHKIEELLKIHEQFENFFEDAVKETIINIEKTSEEAITKSNKISSELTEGKTTSIHVDLELYDEAMEYEYKAYLNNFKLEALSEMKIVYLFKSLEISMKVLINRAYPNINTKSFYRWDRIMSFFKSRGIKISEITGYQEVNQLRKVNNNIKHSQEINDEVKKIVEFNEQEYFKVENLTIFYERVKNKVKDFQKELAKSVVNDLYEFEIERLTELVNSYSKRMKTDTLKEFKELIEKKLKEVE